MDATPASEKLMGHIFSHPFMMADNRRTTFFAHNGGVKADVTLDRKVDSEWAMEKFIASSDSDPKLQQLKDHTGSALNLLILTIDRAKDTPALLRYFHYFKPEKPGKVEYYRMFEADMPGGKALDFLDLHDERGESDRPHEHSPGGLGNAHQPGIVTARRECL